MQRQIQLPSSDPRLIAGASAAGALLLLLLAPHEWLLLHVALTGTAVLFLALRMNQVAKTASDDSDLLTTPLAIAHDPEALALHRELAGSVRDLTTNLDPIYRELALNRTRQLAGELRAVARGEIEFLGTEAWRRAYEQLLRSSGLYRYRSAAYVRTAAYWQDEPGRQSMRVNYEMISSGLIIERIAVVADTLWPDGERLPVEPIASWIDDQAQNGVKIRLVRASRIENDLLADFGLYGNRAVGRQEIDDLGRTVRFVLSFDFAELLAAEARWEKLAVYAESYPTST